MARETIRSLLLIDGDAGQRRLVSAIAARAGWRTTVAESDEGAFAALRAAHANTIEAILIDQHDEAPTLVAELRSTHPDKAVYVLATMEDLAIAVEAMRAGATDYL